MDTKNTVYILRSETNPSRRYTGLTSDIEQRLQWHNAGQNTHTISSPPVTNIMARPDSNNFFRHMEADDSAEVQ